MSRDKAMLRSEQLTDLHIDFAQEILKKQFPRIYGLESTLLITRSSKLPKLPKNSLFLQIVHSRGNWIAISALRPALEVQVYNSIYDNIDKETKNLCINLFGAGVIKFWASRRYGDPRPQIYVVLGTGVPISTVDMGTPPKFWGPHVTTSTRRWLPMSTA